MAKKKRASGPGRGRRNAPRDPETGRLLGRAKETPTSGAAVSAPATVSTPPSTPEMVPAGATELPKEIERDISGFRKAMSERLKEMGETESGVQEAVLDGLRNTAEQLVRQNADIFGKRGEKTVDQSAAYEVLEGVVGLSEQAASAKTVEQKRKILQRLKTYKAVVEKVIVGKDPRLSAISGKILEMIENIEKPLSRESGIRAAAKEKITDFAKKIPERMAAKIPLIGGILSRSLQRRREKKEEEATALSDLTEQISRAGRTSLYGKRGEDIDGIPSTEPPIFGMSPVSDIIPTSPEGTTPSKNIGTFSTDNETRKNIASILIQVKDIKQFLFDRFDPATEETKAEEARREEADRLADLAKKQKDKTGKIIEGAEKKGVLDSIFGLFDGGISGMVKKITGALGGVASSIASTLAGIALPAMGVLAAAAGGALVGYMINEKWIKPWWDEQQKKDERTFQKMATTGQKTVGQIMRNEKGEMMYMVGEGKDREVMSETELDQKIKTATDENEKQKYEDAIKKGPITQYTDVKTGIVQNQMFKQGETTESFKERLRAKKQAEQADPGGVDFNKFADQAAIIENTVRTALPEMEKLEKPEADGMALSFAADAITLYHRVENNKKMSNEQKERIYKISPLVKYLGSNYEKVSDMTGMWDSGGGAYFELKRGIGVSGEWDESEQKYRLVEESQEYKDRFGALKRRSDINKSEQMPVSAVETEEKSVYDDLPPLPPIPSLPAIDGTVEQKSTAPPIPPQEMNSEKVATQKRIDEINAEMRKMEAESKNTQYDGIEGQNRWLGKRKELNQERQELYKQLYSSDEGSILTPPTPATDVGRATMELEKARTAVEDINQQPIASPTINAVSAPKTTNNAITVNNNSGTSTRNNDPTLKAAERGII